MDPVDQIPVVVRRLCDGPVSQDAGVVDDDVHAAEVVDGRLDDGGAILHGVVVGHGFATY